MCSLNVGLEVRDGEGQRLEEGHRSQCIISSFKIERDMRVMWQRMWVASNCWKQPLTASKKTGISVLQMEGTEFCQWQEWAWQRNFPQNLKKRIKFSRHLDFSLVILWAENVTMPFQTSDLQNCQLIHGFYFKLLSLWWHKLRTFCKLNENLDFF